MERTGLAHRTDTCPLLLQGLPRVRCPGDGPPGLPAGYADVLADIGPAHVLGMSLGGAVGAHLAAETELVERLVSCGAGLGPYGGQTIARWRDHAATRRYRALHTDYTGLSTPVPGGSWCHPFTVPAPGCCPNPPPRVTSSARVRPCSRTTGVSCWTCRFRHWSSVADRTRSFPSTATGTARRLDGPAALVPGGHGVYEERRKAVAGAVRPFLDGRALPSGL